MVRTHSVVWYIAEEMQPFNTIKKLAEPHKKQFHNCSASKMTY